MFEGVPDQFHHQFIASRTTSLPLPSLSFPPLHGPSNTAAFPSFDPYCTTSATCHQQVPVLQPNFLQPLHQVSSTNKNEVKQENSFVAMNLEIDRESVNQWSNDEVLALLRIRSGMENWFPEFTWEHVSRKLAELGFKRSAIKCKEKFEEESRYFNSNINYHKNYRAFTEFEEIYHGDVHHEVPAEESNKKLDKPSEEEEEEEEEKEDKMGQNLEEETRIDHQTVVNQSTDDHVNNSGKVQVEKSKSKKRKRVENYEMFKGLCEDIVNKMMAQQEEMHNKLLQDMVKRDKEKVAREEAWKKLEMERVNKELELRAHEQALAGDRQARLIKFLSEFTSSTDSSAEILGERSAQDLVIKAPNFSNASASSSLVPVLQNPNPNISETSSNLSQHETPTSPTRAIDHQKCTSSLPAKPRNSLTENQALGNPNSTLAQNIPKVPSSSTQSLSPQNPNSLSTENTPSPGPPRSLPIYSTVQTKCTSNDRDDIGKRWPRDEVLALINLRCSLYNNNEDKEGSAKAPLWERISQGMLEMGYKRSAKRCKEKWENINKYFRKTKDVNKKRSSDSRTCPYFHQLSTLYNQGTLVAPENRPNLQETRLNISSQNGTSNSTTQVAEGEKNMVQASPLDFEF